jgi:PPM family protein phosphatase
MMKRHFTGHTDPGLLRSVNQDSYYLDPEGRFFVVADGMGGHAGGQEASQIATKQIKTYLDEHWESEKSSDVLLQEALHQANQGILEDQYIHPERGDMGTTAVVVAFRQDKSWYAHIGDSRLYRIRESELAQISEDHTWVARALKVGDITLEQAKEHPWRHVLFQCLGRKDLHQMDIYSFDVQSGDVLLMCSDGLTEEVPDELINEVVQTSNSCEEAVTQLIESAKKAGGSDNITVVLIAQE